MLIPPDSTDLEYDDERRAELLSLGNRSVRNVNRGFSSGFFAYTAAVKGRWPWQLLVASLLVALLATLATFQYQWLGEVSQAERERMRASVRTRATDLSREFDSELTRTYVAF